jgi:hypothetical protein
MGVEERIIGHQTIDALLAAVEQGDDYTAEAEKGMTIQEMWEAHKAKGGTMQLTTFRKRVNKAVDRGELKGIGMKRYSRCDGVKARAMAYLPAEEHPQAAEASPKPGRKKVARKKAAKKKAKVTGRRVKKPRPKPKPKRR